MKSIILTRFAYSPEGTFGHLTMPSGKIFATVERPWLDNEPMVSCIPIGIYRCNPSYYYRGDYEAFEITGVINRSRILFHIGNYVRNTNGCILINTRHGAVGHEWCGVASRSAYLSFMTELDSQPFDLVIKNIQGGVP